MKFPTVIDAVVNVANIISNLEYQEKNISLLDAYNKLLSDEIKLNGYTANKTESK